jgi:uncharacterized membrane protein affecting hemolysin expression
MTQSRISLMVMLLLGGIIIAASLAFSQTHESNAGLNLAQNYVSHADATISATASPTPLLTPNANRVEAYCSGVSGTTRVGDASIGGSQGTIVAANATVELPVTSGIYAYSTAGSVTNCSEVVRP